MPKRAAKEGNRVVIRLSDDEVDAIGALVREVWVEWAAEQPDPKPSWLTPWEDLDEGQRQVDKRIGATIAAVARAAERDRVRATVTAASFTLFRPGNGPAHGQSLEVVPLAELLAVLGGLAADESPDSGPDVHIGWHMTPDEWLQLRAVLRSRADVPYIRRLQTEGALDG
jgi:hypothetical protein